MKKLINYCLVLLFILSKMQVKAQCTEAFTDGSDEVHASNVGFLWGQGFIPDCSGQLEYVQFYASTSGTIPAGTLNIYQADNVDRPTIYTQEFPEIVMTGPGPIRISLTGELAIKENKPYIFEFFVNNVSIWAEDSDASYNGGRAYQNGSAINTVDFNFEVSIINPWEQCTIGHQDNPSSVAINSLRQFGQSFVAHCTGAIDYVQLFSAGAGTLAGGSVKIYEGTSANTTPIYTQAFDAIQSSDELAPLRVHLDDEVLVKKDSMYLLEFEVNDLNIVADFSGGFDEGVAYDNGGQLAGVDFLFEVGMRAPLVTAIEDDKYYDLSFFPNPVVSSLSLNGLPNIVNKYSLYNASGSLLERGVIAMDGGLSVDHLKDGLYFLKIGDAPVLRFIKE